MSKFSFGAILALVSLVPNIRAAEKPLPDGTIIQAKICIMTVNDSLTKDCNLDPTSSGQVNQKELNALLNRERRGSVMD